MCTNTILVLILILEIKSSCPNVLVRTIYQHRGVNNGRLFIFNKITNRNDQRNDEIAEIYHGNQCMQYVLIKFGCAPMKIAGEKPV